MDTDIINIIIFLLLLLLLQFKILWLMHYKFDKYRNK
jgi:hypothetical protein